VLIISVPIMKQLFSKDEKRYELGGMQCTSKNECVYHVICHELIHFIASVECPELVTSRRGHNGIFKQLIQNIFGHTNFTHSLDVDMDKKIRLLDAIKTNFKIGDAVTFEYGKNIMHGQILTINNRVKIITSDKRMFYIGPEYIINDKKHQTRKQPTSTTTAASSCSSYNAEPECTKSKYNCVWGKTKRCSKKRSRTT